MRIEILVEVVEKGKVQRCPEIVVQGIVVFQNLILWDDIAAVGHGVGGEDHSSGAYTKGNCDHPPCFVPVQELGPVGGVEKVIVYGNIIALSVKIGAFRHQLVEKCSDPPGTSGDAVQ